MPSDFELLDRWRDGDKTAGNELLTRHIEVLHRFFSQKTDAGVDDLIQRTLLACVRSRDSLRKEASFRTFLFTIARHELYADWRSQRRDVEVDFSMSSIEDLNPSPLTVAVENRERRVLLQALRGIPVDLQLAVELFYWEGLTTQELAEVLEIPRGTVKSRLRRAREALKESMERLSASAELIRSTLETLDTWAARVAEGRSGT